MVCIAATCISLRPITLHWGLELLSGLLLCNPGWRAFSYPPPWRNRFPLGSQVSTYTTDEAITSSKWVGEVRLVQVLVG